LTAQGLSVPASIITRHVASGQLHFVQCVVFDVALLPRRRSGLDDSF